MTGHGLWPSAAQRARTTHRKEGSTVGKETSRRSGRSNALGWAALRPAYWITL